jgi:glyoxylase-like metal-dependent hydrolase (beta-lactamase superfamily II)
MRLGNVEYFIVSDGEWRMDGGAIFGVVPKVLWETIVPPDELNRVPMALNCLLVLSQGKRILVDTGFGRKVPAKQASQLALKRPDGDLLDALQRLGYGPEDIDIVINTHLHSDHCGGNTLDLGGSLGPTFPKAEYWIQRAEWAEACYPNERSRRTYLPENFQPLESAGQLRLLSGNTWVTPEVRCVVSRGHSRGHQSVIIECDGHTAIYLGDLAARAAHLEHLAWTTAFDSEPFETIESKRAMRDWAMERGALLFFGHDVRMSSGRLSRSGDEYLVRAA